MKNKSLATLVAFAFASVASLQAQFTIANPSFESPNNTGTSPLAPDNWTEFGNGLVSADSGVIADSNTGIPTAPDGNQWLRIERNGTQTPNSNGRGGFFSDVIGTVQQNTDYEFTFTLGEDSGATVADNMDLFLQTLDTNGNPNNTTFSGSFNPDALIGAGTTVVHSVTINSGTGVSNGDDFRMGFRLDEDSPSSAVLVDNVAVIPEPGTYALMGGGLALLYVMTRRRLA